MALTGISRRRFIEYGAATTAGLLVWRFEGGRAFAQPAAGGVLDPHSIPKYVEPLVIPPAMPRTHKLPQMRGRSVDYYEIAVREFRQPILPTTMGLEPTTVWSYGSVNHQDTFNYPAFTIEADVAQAGARQVDQRPRQAERRLPPASAAGRPDTALGQSARRRAGARLGHVRRPGAVQRAGSDRDPSARRPQRRGERRLPRGVVPARRAQHPGGLRQERHLLRQLPGKRSAALGQAWTPGSAVFQYDNDQRATTLWYHDHTLGMTRAQRVRGAGRASTSCAAGPPTTVHGDALPGPAPALGDPPGTRLLTRSRSRSRTARSTRTARSSTPTTARSSRARAVPAADPVHARRGLRRTERRLADLEPGVLRQHDRRQRPHLAVPRRRAAPLPLPLPERLQRRAS